MTRVWLSALLLSAMFLWPRRADSTENRPTDRPKLGVYLFYGALHSGDIITTEIGLHAGLREGNPLAEDRGNRLILHAGACAAQIYVDSKLKGPWKWVFRGGVFSLSAFAIGHNIHTINEHRKIYGH